MPGGYTGMRASIPLSAPVIRCGECKAEFFLFMLSGDTVWDQEASYFCPYCGKEMKDDPTTTT